MTGNIQESGSNRKEANINKYSMSIALEDKICALYDLYLDVRLLILLFNIYIFLYFEFIINICTSDSWRGWMTIQVHMLESFMMRYAIF